MQSNGVSSVRPTTPAPDGAQPTDAPTATSFLPEPPCGGPLFGSVAALAGLLTQIEEQDRTSGRELQCASDRAAMHEEDERVQAMRQKASDDQSQAWASGLAGIAGGALTVASACANGRTETILAAVGKAAPDVGTIVAGGYRAASDRDDAAAARFETGADADLRSYQEAGDEVQAANDSLQKVRSFLDQVQQTESATRLAAAGYRA